MPRRKIKISAPVTINIVIDVDKFDVPTQIHFMGTFDAHDIFGDLPVRKVHGVKAIKDKCESSPEHNGAS